MKEMFYFVKYHKDLQPNLLLKKNMFYTIIYE